MRLSTRQTPKIIPLAFALCTLVLLGCPDDKKKSTEPMVEDTAHYRVTFDASWSAETHPQDFPATAHWSGLIGATHNSDVRFWQEGSLASLGIKDMAELGAKILFSNEIVDAISLGTAQYKLSGEGIAHSPGMVSLDFEISRDFPLVTLTSMVAPSPDWFVGVSGISLLDGDDWVDERVAELHAYDAGTDDGETYQAANAVSDPFVPIRQIEIEPFLVAGVVPSMGTFTFTRMTDESR
ncbi:MAG TPA: spondin domain-containing protein [candidate division Zixibacteria bacterium]|jgi:hypothetical protein